MNPVQQDDKGALEEIKDFFVEWILSWKWLVKGTRYLIVSGGIIAESAFLIATLYVTLVVMAHQLLVWMLWFNPNPDKTISILNQVAVLIFSWIPELIVSAAIKTSIDHWKMARATKNKWARFWAIAYTVPTAIFLIMTIVTILSFVDLQQVNAESYKVTGLNLNMRVLFGWIYGVIGMLYDSVGQRGYAETVADLQTQNEALVKGHRDQVAQLEQEWRARSQTLQTKVEELSGDLGKANQLLHDHKSTNKRLIEEMQKTDDAALQAYGDECLRWLKSGIKTALVGEITRFTGISKRKITNAITSGDLQVSSRNKELVMVSSLLQWLKNTPPPAGKTEPPELHIVNE